MVTRRKLILSGATALLATVLPRHAAAADDPAGILAAIYTGLAKGKGDGGGTFVIQTKAARTKYLSNALVALWAKADVRTRKGDGGPVGFDPVTNSQDPDVKSFKVAAEKAGSRQGDRRRHDRKSSAGRARQSGRQDHPLRLCPRGRPMEDRRHQGSRRRRPVVGPCPARRFIEVLGFKSKARRSRVRPASLPVITADGWPGPGRSSANPARAEAHPAARRLHRGRHARPEACRHRSSRR
jgi:hypothetical protein